MKRKIIQLAAEVACRVEYTSGKIADLLLWYLQADAAAYPGMNGNGAIDEQIEQEA